MHGGAISALQRAARERLLMLVEPALEVLYRATRSAPPCEHCGRSDADRDPTAVRAAGMILLPPGLHPTLTVEYCGARHTLRGFRAIGSRRSLSGLRKHARPWSAASRKPPKFRGSLRPLMPCWWSEATRCHGVSTRMCPESGATGLRTLLESRSPAHIERRDRDRGQLHD